MLRFLVTLVIIGVAIAVSDRPRCGTCPTITPQYIDPMRMAGEWDEWKRSVNTQDDTASCEKLNFHLPDKNGDIQLTFSSISSLLGGNSSLAGVARLDQNKITVSLHLPVLGIVRNATYYILETDYDNYYVVWSCEQYGKKYVYKVYVKVRNPEAACGIDAKIENALMKRNLPIPHMTKENRKNCPCGN